MKKYLIVLLALGIAQTSIAAIEISNKTLTSHRENISNSYGSSQNTYSTNDGSYVSSNEDIKRAIDSLSAHAEKKQEQLAELTKRLESDRQLKQAELAEQQRELAKKPNARIGMTKNQILNKSNWGEPDNINTTIDAYGTFEQWIYGGGQYLYFKNGKLTTIQY